MKSRETREDREIREKPGDRKGRQSRKRRRIRNVALAWLLVLASVAGVSAMGVKLFLSMGYRHLHDSAVFSMPQLPDMADAGEAAPPAGQPEAGPSREEGQEEIPDPDADMGLGAEETIPGQAGAGQEVPENDAEAGGKKRRP